MDTRGVCAPTPPPRPRSSHCALNRAARARRASPPTRDPSTSSAQPSRTLRRASSSSPRAPLRRRLGVRGVGLALTAPGLLGASRGRAAALLSLLPLFLFFSPFFALFWARRRSGIERPAPRPYRRARPSRASFGSPPPPPSTRAAGFPGLGAPGDAPRSVNWKGIPKRSARCFRFSMSASMAATSAARSAAISSSDFLGSASSAAAAGVSLSFAAVSFASGSTRSPASSAGSPCPARRAPWRRCPSRRGRRDRRRRPRLRPGCPRARRPPPREGAPPRRRREIARGAEKHSLDAGGVQALLLARVAEFLRWDGMKWAGESGGRFGRGGRGRLESHKDAQK